MRTIVTAIGFAALLGLASVAPAMAQGAGAGPVGTQCKADIAKVCKNASHGNMEARACLEANRDKVSSACRRALDTTGGRGMGRNRQP